MGEGIVGEGVWWGFGLQQLWKLGWKLLGLVVVVLVVIDPSPLMGLITWMSKASSMVEHAALTARATGPACRC